MGEQEQKAYDAGKAGNYHHSESFTESQAFQQGRNDRAEEAGYQGGSLDSMASNEERQAYKKGQDRKNAPSVSEALANLLKVVVKLLDDMGVCNWRGYVGGVAIFFESMILLGVFLAGVLGAGIAGILIAAFGGGFLFVLQKIPVVRQFSPYAYPALWLLGMLITGGFGDKTVSTILVSLVCAGLSYGVHYLFSLGFVSKKKEDKIDMA